MSRKPEKIYRCDVVGHAMNPGKERAVLHLLAQWRIAAVAQATEQWRLFFETGRFNNRLRTRVGFDVLGTSFGQMVRYQVVGVLDSFMSNRANDFRSAVNGSSLSSQTQHQLHFINRWKAWFTLSVPLTMQDGTVIDRDVRRLARAIMRAVLSRHSKPNVRHLGMVIDQRMVSLAESAPGSHFQVWARLSTLKKGVRVEVPLVGTDRMLDREGKRALTIQVHQDRETKALRFGVLTECTQAFVESRQAYQPRMESIALDTGLCTLLATSEGGLLGQRWLPRLEWHDKRITGLAKRLQSQGIKPNHSARYRRYVTALRGWIESEVGRTLNRLVAVHAPAEIVTEQLDFRAPGLSRRLNRLMSKFGKGCIQAKLKDLEERFGITSTLVNPAYSSQSCSSPGCGYTDKRNRSSQRTFRCLFCGSQRHADVNAAFNLRDRRSDPTGDCRRHRHSILTDLVHCFNKRHPKPRQRPTSALGRAADPRDSNPYFKGWAPGVGSTGTSRGLSTR